MTVKVRAILFMHMMYILFIASFTFYGGHSDSAYACHVCTYIPMNTVAISPVTGHPFSMAIDQAISHVRMCHTQLKVLSILLLWAEQ